MGSPAEKKRKQEKDASASDDGMLAAQASMVPAMDTSKWPLLLKVCQHNMGIDFMICM